MPPSIPTCRYITTFQSGFDSGLPAVQLLFMQSDGGLAPVDGFSGHKAVLSGPAGGYVGYALTTRWEGAAAAIAADTGADVRKLQVRGSTVSCSGAACATEANCGCRELLATHEGYVPAGSDITHPGGSFFSAQTLHHIVLPGTWMPFCCRSNTHDPPQPAHPTTRR
jgi:hypothetical protein